MNIDFRSWAIATAGEEATRAAIGLMSLPTYDADPGRLSAAFVRERLGRTLTPDNVRYPIGGWSPLVEQLAGHAGRIGVTFELDAPVESLPEPPAILALPLRAAGRLLGDASLSWTGAHVALLDLGVTSRSGWPAAAVDLDQHVYVARYSAGDDTLAPLGCDLLQASAGVRVDETATQAHDRIERVVDSAYPAWRKGERWRRALALSGCSGALDLPGTSWRDRPAVVRGGGIFLAGDMTASPGLLSEVAINSASEAARHALSWAEHRDGGSSAPTSSRHPGPRG